MQIDLVAEGLRFMILGMSSVFAFLSVLIVVLKLQGGLLAQLGLSGDAQPAPKPANTPQHSLDQIDNDTIAAISVAINKFRSQK